MDEAMECRARRRAATRFRKAPRWGAFHFKGLASFQPWRIKEQVKVVACPRNHHSLKANDPLGETQNAPARMPGRFVLRGVAMPGLRLSHLAASGPIGGRSIAALVELERERFLSVPKPNWCRRNIGSRCRNSPPGVADG